MGVANGGNTLYSLKCLKRADVAEICRGLFIAQKALSLTSAQRPTIDADCNNVGYITGRIPKPTTHATEKLLSARASCGLTVVPICDGDICPKCKQATNKRKAERERSRIKAFILRK